MNVIQFGDAACGKVRGYLDSYLSNELLVETNHEVLRHLESCPQCAAELSTRARVRTGLQAAVRGTPRAGRPRSQGAARRACPEQAHARRAVYHGGGRYPDHRPGDRESDASQARPGRSHPEQRPPGVSRWC
jgi:anti-sigma factor RsiW